MPIRRAVPVVVLKAEALADVMEAAGISSVSKLAALIKAEYGSPSKAMLHALVSGRECGVRLPLARNVAAALHVPVGLLFEHADGQALKVEHV